MSHYFQYWSLRNVHNRQTPRGQRVCLSHKNFSVGTQPHSALWAGQFFKLLNGSFLIELNLKLLEFFYVNAEQGSIVFWCKKSFLKLKQPCLEKHRPSAKCPPSPLFLRHCGSRTQAPMHSALKPGVRGTFWIELRYFQKLVTLGKKWFLGLFCLICSSQSFFASHIIHAELGTVPKILFGIWYFGIFPASFQYQYFGRNFKRSVFGSRYSVFQYLVFFFSKIGWFLHIFLQIKALCAHRRYRGGVGTLTNGW